MTGGPWAQLCYLSKYSDYLCSAMTHGRTARLHARNVFPERSYRSGTLHMLDQGHSGPECFQRHRHRTADSPRPPPSFVATHRPVEMAPSQKTHPAWSQRYVIQGTSVTSSCSSLGILGRLLTLFDGFPDLMATLVETSLLISPCTPYSSTDKYNGSNQKQPWPTTNYLVQEGPREFVHTRRHRMSPTPHLVDTM